MKKQVMALFNPTETAVKIGKCVSCITPTFSARDNFSPTSHRVLAVFIKPFNSIFLKSE